VKLFELNQIISVIRADAPDGLSRSHGCKLKKHPCGQFFDTFAMLLRFHCPILGLRFEATGVNLPLFLRSKGRASGLTI
jgi:hypothetical protein